MSSGILRNHCKTKIKKAKTLSEYWFAFNTYVLYELNVLSFNKKEKFKQFLINKY